MKPAGKFTSVRTLPSTFREKRPERTSQNNDANKQQPRRTQCAGEYTGEQPTAKGRVKKRTLHLSALCVEVAVPLN